MYDMDMSLVDMDTLQQLHKLRPEKSEIDLITAHFDTTGDLDKPDMLVVLGSCDVV